MNSIDKINKLTRGDFISIFGNVFEKTNWVAEKTYVLKPFNNFGSGSENPPMPKLNKFGYFFCE